MCLLGSDVHKKSRNKNFGNRWDLGAQEPFITDLYRFFFPPIKIVNLCLKEGDKHHFSSQNETLFSFLFFKEYNTTSKLYAKKTFYELQIFFNYFKS